MLLKPPAKVCNEDTAGTTRAVEESSYSFWIKKPREELRDGEITRENKRDPLCRRPQGRGEYNTAFHSILPNRSFHKICPINIASQDKLNSSRKTIARRLNLAGRTTLDLSRLLVSSPTTC
jgi:hypothetical protein